VSSGGLPGVGKPNNSQPGRLNGAAGGNSADLLGQTVRLPAGTVASGGAGFFGHFSGGVPFQSRFFNLIGKGYSQLDGSGFVNAEAGGVDSVRKNRHKWLIFRAERAPHSRECGPFSCGRVRAARDPFLLSSLAAAQNSAVFRPTQVKPNRFRTDDDSASFAVAFFCYE
jgi:hypothetical protein